MVWSDKDYSKRGEENMGTPKSPEKGGFCCPYCADSKFPCVTMERQMRKGAEAEKKKDRGKDRE